MILGTIPVLAAVLSPFDCDENLGNIFLTVDGKYINVGSYEAAKNNYPASVADIDDSVAWKVTNIMTNDVVKARIMATTATNKNINIPQETWDYINEHL